MRVGVALGGSVPVELAVGEGDGDAVTVLVGAVVLLGVIVK